jgi:UDPglucose 6-dehydrogenase
MGVSVNKELKVAFLGMSHLGIVSAISLATKHFQCFGVDINSSLIDDLNLGKWPIREPSLDETYQSAKDNLTFTSDIKQLSKCQIVYISQDVPTDESGNSDLREVEKLIQLASQMAPITTRIIILCQVPPGFTRKMKKYHSNISYQVETLIFGEAFSRALRPERIIIGLDNPNVPLESNLNEILTTFSCPIISVDFETAEFTKLSINAYLAASVATTNSLSGLATFIGADWSSIKKSLMLDKRIGKYAYLSPGLGISGGNIERDLRTLDNLALVQDKNQVSLFRTYLENSQLNKEWLNSIIDKEILSQNPNAKIGILGIAYKENTNSTKNSLALSIITRYSNNVVGAYDPAAVFPEVFSQIKVFSTSQECIKASEVIIVVTPWPEFAKIDLDQILNIDMKKLIVIDPFKIFGNLAKFNETKIGKLFVK